MLVHNIEKAFVNDSVFNLKTNLKKRERVHCRSLTLSTICAVDQISLPFRLWCSMESSLNKVYKRGLTREVPNRIKRSSILTACEKCRTIFSS